jgi:hypothetical protein
MGNVLSTAKRQQVLALGELGWPLRRIEEATGVRRETASRYLKAAGVPVRASGRWGHGPPKPAKDPTTDSGAKAAKDPTTGSEPPRGVVTDPNDVRIWLMGDEGVSGGSSGTPKTRRRG